jgi:hypothetical protein
MDPEISAPSPLIGLSAVAARIKEHLQSVHCTTQADISNLIIEAYKSTHPDMAEEKTLARRTYDVITVLTCIGYIKKENRSLTWIGATRPQIPRRGAEITARTARIESKEESVRYKARLLLLHRALIQANRRIIAPVTKIPFPLILIGQKGADLTVQSDPGNHELWIEAHSKPKLMSPFEILSSKTFTKAAMEQAVSNSPELLPVRDLLKNKR